MYRHQCPKCGTTQDVISASAVVYCVKYATCRTSEGNPRQMKLIDQVDNEDDGRVQRIGSTRTTDPRTSPAAPRDKLTGAVRIGGGPKAPHTPPSYQDPGSSPRRPHQPTRIGPTRK